jgi:hypothetical protein
VIAIEAHRVGRLDWKPPGADVGTIEIGCPNGSVSPPCSGISQSAYEFTNIFKAFTG